MKRLEKFLRPYRRESILAPLFKLLEVVFDLMVPVVIAQIIDVGVAKNDHGYIVEMVFRVTAHGSSRTVVQFYRTVLCRKGKCWICDQRQTGNVRPYPGIVIYRTGYARNRHTDHETDGRCEPGAERN